MRKGARAEAAHTHSLRAACSDPDQLQDIAMVSSTVTASMGGGASCYPVGREVERVRRTCTGRNVEGV